VNPVKKVRERIITKCAGLGQTPGVCFNSLRMLRVLIEVRARRRGS
jgi:hypothetical protein